MRFMKTMCVLYISMQFLASITKIITGEEQEQRAMALIVMIMSIPTIYLVCI